MPRQSQLIRHHAPEPPSADLIEKVLLAGDLSQLTPEQRLNYYKSVCESLGLNPLTKPFDYIVLDNKLVLYARKDCTEQLRRLYNISCEIKSREVQDGVYVVVAQAKLPSGRVDESMGAVPLEVVKDNKTYPLTAAAKSNNMMKAETKAKRRVTLSVCGLGIMDESEIDVEYDQRVPDEIIERNVKQATANVAGEQEKPAPVTDENYGDVVCHIGKAEGTLLGKKVSEIHPKLLEWLRDNWIPKLAAVPSDKDARLRDAILLSLKHKPAGNNVELATALIKRAEELIMTPDQLSRLLKEQGLMEENQMVTDLPIERLQYLMSDEGWNKLKEIHEANVKPKVAPEKPGKAKRKAKKQDDSPFN